MGLVLLDSDTLGSTTQFIGRVPPGNWSSYVLRISGTNDTALQLLRTEIGRIRLANAGRDIVNVAWDQMADIWNHKFGLTTEASASAGAFNFCNKIPRGWMDGNADIVSESDLKQVIVTYGAAFNTDVASGTIELYGEISETGVGDYELKIIQHDEDISAGGTFRIPLREENLMWMFVSDSAGIDRVRIIKDGLEFANMDDSIAIENSNMDNEEFASTFSLPTITPQNTGIWEIPLSRPGVYGEFLTDEINVEVLTNTSIAPLTMIQLAADFTPNKQAVSRARATQAVNIKLDRKRRLGRTRPVRVVANLA